MKKLLTTKAATILLLLFLFSSSQAGAQNPNDFPPEGPPEAQANQDANWRNALNLTPDQMIRIREIRERNRTERQAINRRLGQARRALDQAIYSDEVNEAEVERLARELAEAQAAEVRLRAMTELSIRRVLTSEQLNIFRAIRMQRMREAQMRRRMENPNQQRPGGNPRLENGLRPPLAPGRGDGPPRRIRP